MSTIVQDGQWIVITGLQEQATDNDTKNLPGLPAPIFGTR